MRFFNTKREKDTVLKQLKKGNIIPLLKYTVYRLHLSSFFRVERRNYSMRVWYAPLAFWFWVHPEKEKDDERFLESYLKSGDTVIDCGAHLGTLAMTAGKYVGKDGKVIACEMNPRTFSYLNTNVKENNLENVVCINTAIGDRVGEVKITDFYVSDMNHIRDDGEISVPITTVDEIAKELPGVSLLKLDVEGYELQALKGGEQTLLRTHAVYFESAEKNFERYGYELKDIILFLEERGFSCYTLDQDLKRTRIDSTYHTPVKYENILATRQ